MQKLFVCCLLMSLSSPAAFGSNRPGLSVYSHETDALPASPGDLAGLAYYAADLPESELRRAQIVAGNINSWGTRWSAGLAMVRTHSGDKIKTLCVFEHFGVSRGYIDISTQGRRLYETGQEFSWPEILIIAAPWSDEAYWLLQGGGRSGTIYNFPEDKTNVD